MAKKINFDFKQFLLQKGERVGIGVAAGFTALLIVLGVMVGLGKSSPLNQLKNNAAELDRKIKVDPGPREKAKPFIAPAPEKDLDPEVSPLREWETPVNMENNKRRNPPVLQLTQYKVDVVKAAVRVVEFTKNKSINIIAPPGATKQEDKKSNNNYAQQLLPTRMVVVSGVFPYAEQIEKFKLQLLQKKGGELAAKDMPHFLGCFVYRRDTLPNGQVKKGRDGKSEWEPLNLEGEGSKFRALLAAAADLEPRDDKLRDVCLPGLVMPRPALAPGQNYPDVAFGKDLPELDDKAPEPDKAKGAPMPVAGGGGADSAVTSKRWADITPPAYQRKLLGELNVFDIDAPLLPKQEDEGKDGKDVKAVEGAREVVFPGRNQGGGGGGEKKDTPPKSVLFRFIDVEVEPGHTYEYAIVLRVANPNFGLFDQVAAKEFARVPELLSKWNYIPGVEVPYDMNLFLVDELALEPGANHAARLRNYKKRPPAVGAETKEAPAGKLVVQIHRWVDQVTSQAAREGFPVGDYLVAERLFISRGEPIGREVDAEVPKWNQITNSFEIAGKAAPPPMPKGGVVLPQPKKKDTFSKVDFTFKTEPQLPPAVLVDFHGGNEDAVILVGKARRPVHDFSAPDALIMTPEGKLTVRSAREDADPDTEIGKERLLRYDTWRVLIKSMDATGEEAKKKGPLD